MFLILGAIGPSGGGKTTLLRVLAPPAGNPKPVETTTDVVFSTLDLPTGRIATIDTPSATAHRTSAMIGVLAMDLALVCVSAVDGVTDEFKATLAMLAVLPVVGTVVAITKIDLIEPEDRDDVMRKVREACGHEVRIVAVSATSGEGIESLRRVLSSTVERTKIDRQDARRPWLLPVDRVFVLKDTGLIVSGTVAQGVLSAGVTGMVLPGKVSVRVRELRVGGEPVAEASRGQRVAIQMEGASTDLVRRGTLMAPLGAAYESKLVHAKVEWLAPPQSGERVRVYLGADALSGRLFLSDETPDLVQFRLERTTGIANDLPILVAREPSGAMLGGGRVSVLPVRTAQKAPVVVPKGAPRDQVLSVLAGEVHGVSTDEICRRLDVQPQALGNLFEDLLREGTVLGVAGLWYEPTAFGVARDQFQVALLAVHRETPSSPTIAPEAVVAKAGLPWDGIALFYQLPMP